MGAPGRVRIRARESDRRPSHARYTVPPTRSAAHTSGHRSSAADRPKAVNSPYTTEPAFAPIAVARPARTPPARLLRRTTAVEAPGVATIGRATAVNAHALSGTARS